MAGNSKNRNGYILGIDLGTTTVKVALVDTTDLSIIVSKSRETRASLVSDIGSLGHEQDPGKILTALQFCLSGLPKDELVKVVRIGVSGQMHGVIFWAQGSGWKRNDFGRFEEDTVSRLYTWQDGRCTTDFLDTLPKPDSHLRLSTGHGCATILWLVKNKEDILQPYQCAGTIQDFVVSMLCGLQKPIMSIQNAASWGYFNTDKKSWNNKILSDIGFPLHLLPEVKESGSIAGVLENCWYGIPAGTPIGAALGDLQCSFKSRLPKIEQAVLNISTSAQLAFQMREHFQPPPPDGNSPIEYFPYFDDKYLAVAASLTGGNTIAAFVTMLRQWTHELGLGVPKEKIYDKLHQLGSECSANSLSITPTMFGERHDPTQKATVTNITPLNTTLGSVYSSLCRGIIQNLHSMMSQDVLLAAGVTTIIGSGTAVVKNSILKKEIEEQFKLPLVLSDICDADAAVGAAFSMHE